MVENVPFSSQGLKSEIGKSVSETFLPLPLSCPVSHQQKDSVLLFSPQPLRTQQHTHIHTPAPALQVCLLPTHLGSTRCEKESLPSNV